MKILLDTHILLWLHTNSPELTTEARQIITNPENEIFYSTINIWEVQIKHMNHPKEFTLSGDDLESLCSKANLICLPVATKHVLELKTLNYSNTAPREHKDPFDRMLICQAKSENMRLMTHDTLIPYYNERCVLTV